MIYVVKRSYKELVQGIDPAQEQNIARCLKRIKELSRQS